MKNKIALKLAVIGSLFSAGLHRLTSPGAIALGNVEEVVQEAVESPSSPTACKCIFSCFTT